MEFISKVGEFEWWRPITDLVKSAGNDVIENQYHDILNQTFDFNNSILLRNTLPYKVSDEYAKNDFIIETNQITNQESIVESISEGFVNAFDIINSGSNYKVNDILNFNDNNTSGGGLISRVSSIEGKDIVKNSLPCFSP